VASKLPNYVPGKPYDARETERLRQAVMANTPMRGAPGVKIISRPWGWTAKFRGGSSYAPPLWRVGMSGSYPKTLAATLGPGLVNGVMPVISVDGTDVPIIGNATAKPVVPPPTFLIPQSAFNPQTGQGCLYLQATMNPAGGYPNAENWYLQRVTPVVLPGLPPSTAYTAFKLLGFFILRNGSVTYRSMAFFNLGLGTVFTRSAQGAARYVWWVAS